MALNLILIWPLAHAGLALATSLSALLNAGLLFWGLKKSGIYQSGGDWPKYMFRLVAALALMTTVLFVLFPDMQQWYQSDVWQRSWQLAYIVLAGAGSYFILLFVLGVRIRDFRMH